jgi:hypothetical protein
MIWEVDLRRELNVWDENKIFLQNKGLKIKICKNDIKLKK